MKIIERLFFYFKGRYGNDELSKFLSLSGLIAIVLSMLISNQIISLVGIGLFAYGVLRTMSKEIEVRKKELTVYNKVKYKLNKFLNTLKKPFSKNKKTKDIKNTNTRTIIVCPRCSQKLRVPKRKKLSITCTNCRYKFTKKT